MDATSGAGTRLSGTDAAFLAFEEPGRPMRIGALALFERKHAELEADAVASAVASLLGGIPRFAELPSGGARPVWTRDPGFDARRHVSVSRLAASADDPALARALGGMLSEPLPEGRPLWRVRVLWGLDEGRRFALLLDVHHAMLDGAAGVGLLGRLLGTGPGDHVSDRKRRAPRRRPAAGAISSLLSLARSLRPTSRTALSGEASARRHVAWLSLPEPPLLELARRGGVSANDALLALVAGALRRWLAAAGERPDALRLRALCPVDAGRHAADDDLGNQLGAWVVDLPVREPDPRRRLAQAGAATRRARKGGHAAGFQLLARLSRLLPRWFPRRIMRLAGRLRATTLVVTQPPPLRGGFALLGCPLISVTPFPPLFHGHRCAVAGMRQFGWLQLGITGGWGSEEPTARLAHALREEWQAATRDLPGRVHDRAA